MEDERFMSEALELAARGRGLVSPNPLVGAVVVSRDEIVGRGWHEGPGTPHAEVVALQGAGARASGATLFTSLEPCDHYGRTPPCTQAIVDAGIARVVSAVIDPNPVVQGRGIERLRAAGVEVRDDVLMREASRVNEAFFRHVVTGLPFVTLKMAATLDGKVAARDGSSRWITSDEARADVHELRAAADAIVAGAGTVLADDPSLTVRHPGYRGRPVLRVVVDAAGRVSADARVLSADAPTLVATTELAPQDRIDGWRVAGAEVVVYDARGGRVPLAELWADLGKRSVQGVLLEGGPTLAWSAVGNGLVDKLVVYVAAKLVGGSAAPSVLMGGGVPGIADAIGVEIESVQRIGPDVRLEAYVHRDR